MENPFEQNLTKPKEQRKFDRGTELTVFESDRQEDKLAILVAAFIALCVWYFIGL